MSSQNSVLRTLLYNLTPRQKLAMVVLLGLTGILIIFGIFKSLPSKPKPGDTQTHFDKNSQQSVRTIVGEKETSASNTNGVYILGTPSLLNLGVTPAQINAVTNSFYQYSKINSVGVKQVSISVNKIKIDASDVGSNKQTTTISAPVIIDNKVNDSIKLKYKNASDIELIIYDEKGTLLYDSGTVTVPTT